jgi:hypothetical protein
MWKRIGDNPTHYCSMWVTSIYRVCKGTCWTGQNYPSETGRSSRIDWLYKIPYYKYTPAIVLENENFKLYWNRSILTDKIVPFNWPVMTFMNKKTKITFLTDIAVPNTHNLAKTITDRQNKYQELMNGNMRCVEAKGNTSDPDSNVIYWSNSKVTVTQSNKT